MSFLHSYCGKGNNNHESKITGGIFMSEANKNRNKDKSTQNNRNKFNKQREYDVEIAEDTEFLNLDNKKNKRSGRNKD